METESKKDCADKSAVEKELARRDFLSLSLKALGMTFLGTSFFVGGANIAHGITCPGPNPHTCSGPCSSNYCEGNNICNFGNTCSSLNANECETGDSNQCNANKNLCSGQNSNRCTGGANNSCNGAGVTNECWSSGSNTCDATSTFGCFGGAINTSP